MTTAQATAYFDTTALVEPIDRRAVRRYGRSPRGGDRLYSGCGTVVAVAVVAPFVLAFVGFGIALVVFLATAVGPRAAVPIGVMLGLWALVMTAVVALAVRQTGTDNERAYRLRRFAEANGLEYQWTTGVADRPGMIFPRVRTGYARDVLVGDGEFPIEVGNVRCNRRGRLWRTQRWGYLALRLQTPLPHIVLDAVGNNSLGVSSLPVGLHAGQRLSLEGDFDRVFRLYCPAGYERDALYLFTPDIMARLMDTAAELDVEIIDDRMYFYRRSDLATLDPATWEWLGSVQAAMTGKLAQWERWRDGHAQGQSDSGIPLLHPPRGVAEPGQRLRRTLPWATIALAAASIVTVFQVLGAA